MACAEHIHVLISHANPLVAAGLEAALRARGGFQLLQPDARGADPQLPDRGVMVADCETGMRLMASERGRKSLLLILTDDESEISIRRAVELGIRGYLPLASSVESVIQSVRTIHRGGTAIAPIVMAKMAVSLRSRPLTRCELEVLTLVMQGLPDKAIARRLERSVGTAKAHVKSILTKLDASSRAEAIAVARRRGLVRDEGFMSSQERVTSRFLHGDRAAALV